MKCVFVPALCSRAKYRVGRWVRAARINLGFASLVRIVRRRQTFQVTAPHPCRHRRCHDNNHNNDSSDNNNADSDHLLNSTLS